MADGMLEAKWAKITEGAMLMMVIENFANEKV